MLQPLPIATLLQRLCEWALGTNFTGSVGFSIPGARPVLLWPREGVSLCGSMTCVRCRNEAADSGYGLGTTNQRTQLDEHCAKFANKVALMSGRSERVGWLLFIISAVFFTVSSLRSGDLLALGGSLFFLVACFFFLAPHWRAKGRGSSAHRSARNDTP